MQKSCSLNLIFPINRVFNHCSEEVILNQLHPQEALTSSLCALNTWERRSSRARLQVHHVLYRVLPVKQGAQRLRRLAAGTGAGL